MSNYDDIIDLPHHVSSVHKKMSINERSAMFAPFSALTGYNESIKEATRITNERIIISDDDKEIITKELNKINIHIKEKPVALVTYFNKDLKKAGGSYITKRIIIKKIDLVEEKLILFDKSSILFKDIIKIEMIVN